jgi:hypothetical protein
MSGAIRDGARGPVERAGQGGRRPAPQITYGAPRSAARVDGGRRVGAVGRPQRPEGDGAAAPGTGSPRREPHGATSRGDPASDRPRPEAGAQPRGSGREPVPPDRPPLGDVRGPDNGPRRRLARLVLRSLGSRQDEPCEGGLGTLPEGRLGRLRVPRPRPSAFDHRPEGRRTVPALPDLPAEVRAGERRLGVPTRCGRPDQGPGRAGPAPGGVRVRPTT